MEGDYQYGTVIMAPHETVVTLLRNADSVATWGARVVGCCLTENNVPTDSVGSRRRCVLQPIPGASRDRIVRETVVAHKCLPTRAYITTRLTEAVLSETMSPQQVQIISCVPALDLVTTITISPVAEGGSSTQPSIRCFVDWYSTFQCASSEDIDATRSFLHTVWARPLVEALSDYALNVVLPIGASSAIDAGHRKQFDEFENVVVRLSAEVKQVNPHVVAGVERLFDSWTLQCRDLAATGGIISGLRLEIQSHLSVQSEMARRIADLTTENNRLHADVVFAKHGVFRGDGDASANAEAGSATSQQQHPPSIPVEPPLPVEQPPAAAPVQEVSEADNGQQNQPTAVPEPPVRQVKSAAPPVHQVSGRYATLTQTFSDDLCRDEFLKLDKAGTGLLPVATIAALMSAVDPRSDYDILREVQSKQQQGATTSSHAAILTPRKQQAGGAASPPSSLPSNRGEYFSVQAKNWVRRNCSRPEEGVNEREFAVLKCHLAKF